MAAIIDPAGLRQRHPGCQQPHRGRGWTVNWAEIARRMRPSGLRRSSPSVVHLSSGSSRRPLRSREATTRLCMGRPDLALWRTVSLADRLDGRALRWPQLISKLWFVVCRTLGRSRCRAFAPRTTTGGRHGRRQTGLPRLTRRHRVGSCQSEDERRHPFSWHWQAGRLRSIRPRRSK
jgi:hypothetical protein